MILKLDVLKRIRDAADHGDSFAQFELAIAFDYGTDGEQDFQRASDWYLKASRQGHQAAEGNLLLQHVFGQVSIRRPRVVFSQLKQRAESGDREAENNLGLCYQFGYGTAPDCKEASIWFRRGAQAAFAAAQFNLGGLYYEGKGVRRNLKRAITWYTRAAEQRYELALIQLGNIYQKGEGLEVDMSRAFLLYLIAYRVGSIRAANHLAIMFRRGFGVERDDRIAHSLFLEAVGGFDTPDTAVNLSYHGTAFYWLGRMAEHGEGTRRDLKVAKRWYKFGAAINQPDCTEALARLRKAIGRTASNKQT